MLLMKKSESDTRTTYSWLIALILFSKALPNKITKIIATNRVGGLSLIVFYSPELTMMIFEVKFSNFISYQKASFIQIIRRKYNTFTSKFCVTRPEYWHYWRLRPVYRLTMTDIRVSENTIPDRTDWFHLNFRIRVICNIGSQMDRRKWLAGNVTILRVDLFA